MQARLEAHPDDAWAGGYVLEGGNQLAPTALAFRGRETLVMFNATYAKNEEDVTGGNTIMQRVVVKVGVFAVTPSDDPAEMVRAKTALVSMLDRAKPALVGWQPTLDGNDLSYLLHPFLLQTPASLVDRFTFPGGGNQNLSGPGSAVRLGAVWSWFEVYSLFVESLPDFAAANYDPG